jgi:sigma-B regulation protein RsbQ
VSARQRPSSAPRSVFALDGTVPLVVGSLFAGAVLCVDPSRVRAFALATYTADERPLLSKLEIPCLLVPCTRDAMVPLSAAEYMRDRLPRAEYRPLHAAGHCPQMSHAPQVEALIREFLPS